MRGDRWKGIAYLAVLAGLAIGLSLLFRGQRPPPVVTLPTVATATCTPMPTPPVPAAPAQAPPPPTATPGPRHLSAAVEVQVPEGFRLEGLEGNIVVGDVEVNGTYQTILLDLVSGEVIETYARPMALVSSRWAVGVESTELADGSRQRWLRIYDRQTDAEHTIEAKYPVELDLSDDVMVWDEYRGDVFAQNLRTGQRWTIAERPGEQGFARISGRWVIYLDGTEYSPEEQVADLRVYDLESGEDRVLGQVNHPLMGSAGTYHAISGSRVVWTTPPSADYTTYQVLSLDLDDPQSQPSVVMSGDFGPSSLRLFGDILVYHWQRGKVLYDLWQGEELTFLDRTTAIFISGNRVVWEALLDVDGSGKWSYRLYTARIEQ